MSTISNLRNCVKSRRAARGWSQQALAEQAGVARASVSAIEMGRLTPSTAAALALAHALGCRVEDLFQLHAAKSESPDWAWESSLTRTRYWQAEVFGRQLLYPAEATYLGAIAHDGISTNGSLDARVEIPPPTLVVACCDPAVGLLAAELARVAGIRLLPFFRSSRQALRLLKQGLVHVAGIHFEHGGDNSNAAAVKAELGAGYKLLHVADWEEGVVTATARRFSSLSTLVRARLRWIGREPGSAARQCMDELLGSRRTSYRIAHDHRGVAEAVRSGFGDAGICVRLVGEEAGLNFLTVREEGYDLCFPDSLSHDPRISALVQALRSAGYRRAVNDLPGYNAQKSGRLISLS